MPISISEAAFVTSQSYPATISITGSTLLGESSNSLYLEAQSSSSRSPPMLRREGRKISNIQESKAATSPIETEAIAQPDLLPQPSSRTSQRREAGSYSSKTHLSRQDHGFMSSFRRSEHRPTSTAKPRSSSEKRKERAKDTSKQEVRGRQAESSTGRRRHSTSTTRDQNRQQEKGKQDKSKKPVK